WGEDPLRERQRGAGDVPLNPLVAQVARDLDARLAVDAVEDRVRLAGRVDHAVLDHETVLAGPLADVALVVEEDRLLVAGLDRLDLREHGVEVLARRLRMRDE